MRLSLNTNHSLNQFVHNTYVSGQINTIKNDTKSIMKLLLRYLATILFLSDIIIPL